MGSNVIEYLYSFISNKFMPVHGWFANTYTYFQTIKIFKNDFVISIKSWIKLLKSFFTKLDFLSFLFHFFVCLLQHCSSFSSSAPLLLPQLPCFPQLTYYFYNIVLLYLHFTLEYVYTFTSA